MVVVDLTCTNSFLLGCCLTPLLGPSKVGYRNVLAIQDLAKEKETIMNVNRTSKDCWSWHRCGRVDIKEVNIVIIFCSVFEAHLCLE